VADHTLLLRAGPERSVAATKTYTAQLTALAMLSAAVAGDSRRKDELASVPAHLAAALDVDADAMAAAAATLKDAGHGVVIGRGFNYATAFEIALKAKELAYFAVEPSRPSTSSRPIALIDPGFAAIVVNVDGAVSGRSGPSRDDRARRARSSVEHEFVGPGARAAALPAGVPEWALADRRGRSRPVAAFHLSRARLRSDQPAARRRSRGRRDPG
jgi:glucosamine--fructose-6-phosphate aminotransferase (isomerizing)